ncbi:MAG: HugZ family protein [Hyphomicrobiaceae bacterium]
MTEKKKDVLQPVDDEARRQAKALVRSARYAALGTLDPIDGSPAVSRVSLSTAINGDPCFFISRLSGHFGNLEADARCSVLVGEPGKGDPLAHPRMTIIGRASKVEGDALAAIKSRYLMRHPKAQLYAEFPDFAMWRVTPLRASLNGGFGRAFALSAADLSTLGAVDELAASEAGAVAHMNADHSDAVDRYAAKVGAEGTGWRLASLDPEGLDLARGDQMARLWFEKPLASAAELRSVLVALARA